MVTENDFHDEKYGNTVHDLKTTLLDIILSEQSKLSEIEKRTVEVTDSSKRDEMYRLCDEERKCLRDLVGVVDNVSQYLQQLDSYSFNITNLLQENGVANTMVHEESAQVVEEVPAVEGEVVPEVHAPVEETPVVEDAPVVESEVAPEASAPVEETPVVEDAPVVESEVVPEASAPVEETPVVEDAPVVESEVVPEASAPVEETPVVEDAPVVESEVVPEASAPVEKTPVVEDTPAVESEVAPEASAPVEKTPVVEDTPAVESEVAPEASTPVEETPVVENAPVVESEVVPEAITPVEETPVVEDAPVVESEVVPEASAPVEKTPVVEDTPVVENEVVPEASAPVEKTPVVEDASAVESEVVPNVATDPVIAIQEEAPKSVEQSVNVADLPLVSEVTALDNKVISEDNIPLDTFVKNTNDAPKAIITTKNQTDNLRKSYETQAVFFKSFSEKSVSASNTADQNLEQQLVQNGMLEPDSDDKQKQLEEMMNAAQELYKQGKVEEAQAMYAKVSALNQEIKDENGVQKVA